MSISPERKQEVIAEYATKEGDSGSPEAARATKVLKSAMVSRRQNCRARSTAAWLTRTG